MIDLELREKVARLLGHTKHSWPFLPGTVAGFPQCVHCGETLFYHEPEKQAGWCYGYNPPPYETDVAAAWQVVEFMRDKKKRRLRLYERERGDWFAEFVPIELGRAYQLGCVASTAPLAICMAFVAAMETNHES